MRFTEHNLDPKETKEEKEAAKEAEKRVLAGSKDYDYANLGKLGPLKGGNPWS